MLHHHLVVVKLDLNHILMVYSIDIVCKVLHIVLFIVRYCIVYGVLKFITYLWFMVWFD
jgi:hypothetical protein